MPVSGDMINLQVWHKLFHRMNNNLRLDTRWGEKMKREQIEAKTFIASVAHNRSEVTAGQGKNNNHKN